MTPSPDFSTHRSSQSSTPAFIRRFSMLLLASIMLLFLAGSALASIDAPRPVVTEALADSFWDPNELPDVAILVSGLETADPTLERMVIPALREIPGVAAVAAEGTQQGRVALHISLAHGAERTVVNNVHALVTSSLPDAHVSLGGRVVADQDLLQRLNRGTIIAVVPALVLFSVLVAVAFGSRFGSAAGGTVALSTLLGGLVGQQVAGDFDGTLASTAVPAVLVGVLISTVLTLRLLDWFKSPQGNDQAEAIRLSVRHLLPETGLMLGGIVATAVLLELVGSGRATASVVASGGIVATVVTLGLFPALLSTLEPVPAKAQGNITSEIPDGRDFPIGVLGAFSCFLLVLGLIAIRVPNSELMDESALASGVSSRRVSEQLSELGGDPTSAIRAEFPGWVSDDQLFAWSQSVSALGTVGWVQTSAGRFVGGELATDSIATASVDGAVLAIVAPTVTARSEAAQRLVAALQAPGVEGTVGENLRPVLSGPAVDAATIASQSGSHLWILMALLSIAGGVAVFILARDFVMAAAAVALRFLGLAAVLGVYRIVAGDVGASELQVAVLVLGVGVGLFEIGFVRRVTRGLAELAATQRAEGSSMMSSTQRRSEIVTRALHHEGRAALFGLGVVGVCGLGFIVGDLDVARRLGIAVAAAVVVEILIGTWLLRPVVLGQRLVGLQTSAPSPSFQRVRTSISTPSSLDLVLALGTPTDNTEPSRATRGSGNDGAMTHAAVASQSVSGRTVAASSSAGSTTISRGESVAATNSTEKASSPRWNEMLSVGRPLSDTFAAEEDTSPEWRRIVAGLLRSEFAFQSTPAQAQLETVFVEDTPLFGELRTHNQRLRSAGLRIVGEGPHLNNVAAVNEESGDDNSPTTLAITVDHPERRLYDMQGKLVGVRQGERRHGMLWLVQDPSGRYRIAEAVDLGSGDAPSAPAADPQALRRRRQDTQAAH